MVQKSDAYPILLSCHALPVSDFEMPIRSRSIELRNDPNLKSAVMYGTKFSLKISHSAHVQLAELEFIVVNSIPTGDNFYFAELFSNPSMSILYSNARNVRFVLFAKTLYKGIFSYVISIPVHK